MGGDIEIHPLYGKLAEAFFVRGLTDLAHRCGPGGTVAVECGGWRITANPHTVEAKLECGVSVPPFHFALELNGWPAGIVGPRDGFIAAGALANEENLLAVIGAAP